MINSIVLFFILKLLLRFDKFEDKRLDKKLNSFPLLNHDIISVKITSRLKY